MRPLRAAVVGAGRWGRNHVRVLKELEAEGLAEVAAVCDVDLSRARAVAQEFSVPKVYASAEEMLEREGLDAVTVATPIDALAPVARAAIERGVHVLVEKPAAASSSGARDLWRLAESKGVVAMPGFIMRFNPVVLELKRLARDLSAIYFVFRRLSLRPPRARRFPLVLDLTIHDLDLARFLSGADEPKVRSAVVSEAGDGVVLAVLSLGGPLAIVHTDGVSVAKVREIEVIAEGAFVRGDTEALEVLIESRRGRELYAVSSEEPLKRELRTFLEIASGAERAGAPTLRDAYVALRLAEEIVEFAARL